MDDITYLRKYGKEEEYVAFVDSSKRDKSAFLTPSEYAVTWNTPFTLVTGIDIVDISLPMSGYVINTTYNQIRFRFHDPGYDDNPHYIPPPWMTATVRPGNHTPTTLIQELKAKLVEPPRATAIVRRIDVKPASNPFELVGKLLFVSEHPFELDTQGSTMAAVLGFSQLLDVTSSSQIAAFNSREELDLASNQTTMMNGSTRTNRGYSLTRGKFLKQRFAASVSSNLSGLEVMIVPFGDTSALDGYVNFRVVNTRTKAAVAEGKIPVAYPEYSKADLSTVHVARKDSDMFLATETYWLEVFDANNEDPNNCYRVCFGEAVDQSAVGEGPIVVENGVEDQWYEKKVQMTARLHVVPFNYVMLPPGILNLASPIGYVSLKCAEIEKHMYSSRAFETTNMGLAVVNLSNGYQEKYNIIAPKRSFHPIARLSKLTFRWEAPDGSLYDFMGVDNHVTFVLRYYVLPQQMTQIYSSLNPDYKPDLLAWINEQELPDGDSSEGEGDPVSGLDDQQWERNRMLHHAF